MVITNFLARSRAHGELSWPYQGLFDHLSGNGCLFLIVCAERAVTEKHQIYQNGSRAKCQSEPGDLPPWLWLPGKESVLRRGSSLCHSLERETSSVHATRGHKGRLLQDHPSSELLWMSPWGWAIMPYIANTGSIAIAQSGCHRCRLLRCRYLYVSREMLFLVDIPWKIPQTPEGLWKDY